MVDGVDVHEPEGGGGEREVGVCRRESEAVGEWDAEGGKGVRERDVARVVVGIGLVRVYGDVRDPAERERSDGLDERKHVSNRVREAARHQMVVAHEEACWARQRDRIRGHEIWGTQCADVARPVGTHRVEDELLDGRLGACVVDDEEAGRGGVV